VYGDYRFETRYLVVSVKDLFVPFPGYFVEHDQGSILLLKGRFTSLDILLSAWLIAPSHFWSTYARMGE
jgi:hypothetical protein